MRQAEGLSSPFSEGMLETVWRCLRKGFAEWFVYFNDLSMIFSRPLGSTLLLSLFPRRASTRQKANTGCGRLTKSALMQPETAPVLG